MYLKNMSRLTRQVKLKEENTQVKHRAKGGFRIAVNI
jgi:hypothetical protein